MALNSAGWNLKDLVESHGPKPVLRLLEQALERGRRGEKDGLKPSDFSIRQLAEAFLGENTMEAIENALGGQRGGILPAFDMRELTEADAVGVQSSVFLNITGQIIYNATLEAYESVDYVASELMTTVQTSFHEGEKIAGVTDILGKPIVIPEGMQYPEYGLTEDYVQTPATDKRGIIVSLTLESIARDRTGQLLDKASKVGERLAYEKECRLWDCILDVNSTAFRYNNKGTSYATYLTSGGWINDATGMTLDDWTDIDEILIAMADVANPWQTEETEPIVFRPTTLIVPPSLWNTGKRIINATEIRVSTGSGAQLAISANPVAGAYNVVSSAIMYQRLLKSGLTAAQAKAYYFLGSPKRAYRYMEIYPLTMDQQMASSDASFERDVVARWKGRERGVPFTYQPRYMCRRRNT